MIEMVMPNSPKSSVELVTTWGMYTVVATPKAVVAAPAVAPPNSSRRQCTWRLSSRYGIEVHSTIPVRNVTGSAHNQSGGNCLNRLRAPYATSTSMIRTTRPRAANRPPSTPDFSCSHAARNIRWSRRVNETPENSRRKALKTPTPLDPPAGVVKSWVTASAESPDSPNFLIRLWATASSSPAGARAPARMSSGMSAVNACEESTMHRSSPPIRTKRRTQRPGTSPARGW